MSPQAEAVFHQLLALPAEDRTEVEAALLETSNGAQALNSMQETDIQASELRRRLQYAMEHPEWLVPAADAIKAAKRRTSASLA